MAKKKAPRVDMGDDEKIKEWLKTNKIKGIPANVGGEYVMKSFFARKKKNPFKKSEKVAEPVKEKTKESKK